MLKISLDNSAREDDQIGLFNETFHTHFMKEKWEIKHFQNPYSGQSENVCLYEEDELIGFNMFMPHEYCVGDKCMLFLQSCESVVAESKRGHGYLGRILEEAENLLKDKYSVIYGFPNQNSKPTFDKLGYKEKISLDNMIKFGNLTNIAGDLLPKRKQFKFENITNNVFCSDKWVAGIGCNQISDSSICIKRKEPLYKWKIDNNKYNLTRYFYTLDKNNKVDAYCVVVFSATGKFRRADIVDFYSDKAKEDNFELIIDEIRKYASVLSINVASDSDRQRMLIRKGFKIRYKEFAYLVYKVLSNNAELERILEHKQWDCVPIEFDTILN